MSNRNPIEHRRKMLQKTKQFLLCSETNLVIKCIKGQETFKGQCWNFKDLYPDHFILGKKKTK